MLIFRSERVTDTMGRMHSDAQFAGSSSVKPCWLFRRAACGTRPVHRPLRYARVGRPPLLRCSTNISLTRMTRRWSAMLPSSLIRHPLCLLICNQPSKGSCPKPMSTVLCHVSHIRQIHVLNGHILDTTKHVNHEHSAIEIHLRAQRLAKTTFRRPAGWQFPMDRGCIHWFMSSSVKTPWRKWIIAIVLRDNSLFMLINHCESCEFM